MRTIDAVWVRRAVKKLEGKGLSATALLREAEVRPHVLNQKAARVPFHQHAALLDLAAKATQNGCFGLELAANDGDVRDNGLIAYTALSSGNLGEALKVLERYIHVFNEGIDVSVEFLPREVKIVFDPSDAALATARQAMEFGAANFIRGIRCLTNSRLRPLEVRFRHGRSNDIAKLEKLFGCSVHFGSRHNSLTISRSHLFAADRHGGRKAARDPDRLLRGNPGQPGGDLARFAAPGREDHREAASQRRSRDRGGRAGARDERPHPGAAPR